MMTTQTTAESNSDELLLLSTSSSFLNKLEARVAAIDSLLCVGLDPHSKELFPHGMEGITEEMHADAAFTFCKTLIDSTAPFAACYKPNAAFFEAIGPTYGMLTLARVMKSIPSDIPTLLDVKRGDIGSTAEAYAKACYDDLGADAVTLSPLMGWDSLAPFVTGPYSHKGAFVLCKTSNPGSNDLLAQNLTTTTTTTTTLYEGIATLARTWTTTHSVSCLGLVVGATDAVALRKSRQAGGETMWILAPGIGAQGGDLEAACLAGMNAQGSHLLLPISRGISKAPDPAAAAKNFRDRMNAAKLLQLAANVDGNDTTTTTTTIQAYQQEFIEFSLSQGVLKFGSFVLKSGRTSPYFFNAGLFASGAALFKLGKAYASAIMSSDELSSKDGKVKFDVVFGPAYKGISIGAVVCAALYQDFGIDAGFSYNRKEVKDHGEGGQLVGAKLDQQKVLVIDDVITGGTAIRESFDLLKSVAAIPIGVVIALDRAEKRALDDPISAVQAVARDFDIPVISIVNMPQLQAFLEQHPEEYDDSVLTSMSEYRSQYGV